MALEITGKVFTVLPSQSGQGQKGPWVKQNFVIETGDQYPKKVCLLAWNDKAEIVSRLKEGDEVKVAFDLESREFNGKWYTDAKVWKMEVLSQSNLSSSSHYEPTPTASNQEPQPPVSDDLPF